MASSSEPEEASATRKRARTRITQACRRCKAVRTRPSNYQILIAVLKDGLLRIDSVAQDATACCRPAELASSTASRANTPVRTRTAARVGGPPALSPQKSHSLTPEPTRQRPHRQLCRGRSLRPRPPRRTAFPGSFPSSSFRRRLRWICRSTPRAYLPVPHRINLRALRLPPRPTPASRPSASSPTRRSLPTSRTTSLRPTASLRRISRQRKDLLRQMEALQVRRPADTVLGRRVRRRKAQQPQSPSSRTSGKSPAPPQMQESSAHNLFPQALRSQRHPARPRGYRHFHCCATDFLARPTLCARAASALRPASQLLGL